MFMIYVLAADTVCGHLGVQELAAGWEAIFFQKSLGPAWSDQASCSAVWLGVPLHISAATTKWLCIVLSQHTDAVSLLADNFGMEL